VSGLDLAPMGAIAAERVVELALARRNVAWALAPGGLEHGSGTRPSLSRGR
jgi:isoprenylcysteine carboxyl methyltransferase (ICMT) family protein YpbQ